MAAAPKLYLFSGLGADHRAFHLMDFGNFEVYHINWIPPNNQESIEAYALRISRQITTENPVLIGLSFGGMVAMEVAKLIHVEKVILLASAKTKNELPAYYRFAGKIGLHHLMPANLLRRCGRLANWMFGAKTSFEKHLLIQILKDTDSLFLKWAINEIVNWENTTIAANTLHIHGSADRILPLKCANPDIVVKGGTHLMTLNKSKEITAEILWHLNLKN